MGRPYQFYYFVPLVTFWFLVLYVVLLVYPKVTAELVKGIVVYLYNILTILHVLYTERNGMNYKVSSVRVISHWSSVTAGENTVAGPLGRLVITVLNDTRAIQYSINEVCLVVQF
jgi:hypothetical protein